MSARDYKGETYTAHVTLDLNAAYEKWGKKIALIILIVSWIHKEEKIIIIHTYSTFEQIINCANKD